MKKVLGTILLIIAVCICFTGCKKADYQDAVLLQDAGAYDAALERFLLLEGYKDSTERAMECSNAISYREASTLLDEEKYDKAFSIFSSLGDYQDAAQLAALCQDWISSIEGFEVATAQLSQKNQELSDAIAAASETLATSVPLLDETLYQTLDEHIKDAQSSPVSVPTIPESLDEIKQCTEEMLAVDYSALINDLDATRTAFEQSAAQAKVVYAPDAERILSCLAQVPGIIESLAATEETDENGLLNKDGSYIVRVVFSYELVDQTTVYGADVLDKGTDCGGSIEVFRNVADAEKRNAYLGAFDGTWLDSGSHCVIGTIVVRTSSKLTATQQDELEQLIVDALLSLP